MITFSLSWRDRMTAACRSPQNIHTAMLCFLLLLTFARICFIWRGKSRKFTGASSATTDYTDPKNYENCAPVDLTSMGANIELPDDHPLRKMNGVSPANLAPFHNKLSTKDDVAAVFAEFDSRLTKLENEDG